MTAWKHSHWLCSQLRMWPFIYYYLLFSTLSFLCKLMHVFILVNCTYYNIINYFCHSNLYIQFFIELHSSFLTLENILSYTHRCNYIFLIAIAISLSEYSLPTHRFLSSYQHLKLSFSNIPGLFRVVLRTYPFFFLVNHVKVFYPLLYECFYITSNYCIIDRLFIESYSFPHSDSVQSS